MKLVDNWKDILLKAWSAYGLYVIVLSGLLNDYLVPLYVAHMQGKGVELSPGFGTFVSTLATVTLVLRIWQQVSLLIPNKGK